MTAAEVTPKRELTQARLKELLHYDPETGIFTARGARPGPRPKSWPAVGSINGNGYVTIRVDGTTYQGHRLAWLYMTGKWPDDDIDHRNRRRSENRWENLREATNAQNAQNRKLASTNTSGCPGVWWNKDCGKWQAAIKVAGKRTHLGLFDAIADAADAYAAAKAKVHVFNPVV